jgi:hypothetical protein
MCSVVILLRPGAAWPLLLAANRDEMLDRPWRPPGRHWPDRPEVTAGLDLHAGGSWLGLNDHGLVAAMLNRMGSLGPQAGKRSRGELVLEALDHADAADAADALAALEPSSYRSFNMLVADNSAAYWLRHAGGGGAGGRVEAIALPAGISMITAHDRNDLASARIKEFLPRFEAASVPDPEAGEWSAWTALLKSRGAGRESEGESGMCVRTDFGFGTSSSSLIALPAPQPARQAQPRRRPIWLFAAGPPDERPYEPVAL